MQVKIGNKIKELRKRDRRKQEDLANALGVTCQAVSRWESDSCYPDMSLIPSIANYFHITIDTLFGYNNDRDDKIKEYVTAADRFMIENGDDPDPDEVIKMLKKALEEFPADGRVLRGHVHRRARADLLLLVLLVHEARRRPQRRAGLERAALHVQLPQEPHERHAFLQVPLV